MLGLATCKPLRISSAFFDVGRLPTFLCVYIIFSHNGLTFLIVKYIINTKNKSKDKDVLGMNIMPLLFFYFFVKFK